MPNSKIAVRDKHFALSWSLADTKKVEEYTKRLVSMYGDITYQAEYTEMADQMLELINKKENDHHNASVNLAGHDWLKVEPIDSHIGEDLCTFQGLNKLLKIYIGTATGVFKWVGRSLASGTPTPYTTALSIETGLRKDASTTGFHDIKGSSIRVLASYPSNEATITMYQIGIFDAASGGGGGTMLAIHDFGGTPLSHVSAADSFSLGMVIDFSPLGDVGS
jgi:hypothetical protein